MTHPDRLAWPPHDVERLQLLVDRIDSALDLADLRHYDGWQPAVAVPGTCAWRFLQLPPVLSSLRDDARQLASLLDATGADAYTRDQHSRIEQDLERLEWMIVTAAAFHHAHAAVERDFFERMDWLPLGAGELTLRSRSSDCTFTDLNRRYVELERRFWCLPCDGWDDPAARDALHASLQELRDDCDAFLAAAPSPGLAHTVRRQLDCAGKIARESPDLPDGELGRWIADAVVAVRQWDARMRQPFAPGPVARAYAALESLQAEPCAAGLAYAVACAPDPARMRRAWQDFVHASGVRGELARAYAAAVAAQRWVTAAFVCGLAADRQQRDGTYAPVAG